MLHWSVFPGFHHRAEHSPRSYLRSTGRFFLGSTTGQNNPPRSYLRSIYLCSIGRFFLGSTTGRNNPPRSYLRSIGRFFLGSTTGRNNLRPRRYRHSMGWNSLGSGSDPSSGGRNHLVWNKLGRVGDSCGQRFPLASFPIQLRPFCWCVRYATLDLTPPPPHEFFPQAPFFALCLDASF